MIQELWHGTINIDQSDSDPLGLHILGVTANNKWQIYYPPLLLRSKTFNSVMCMGLVVAFVECKEL
jgi:hypothetical protein